MERSKYRDDLVGRRVLVPQAFINMWKSALDILLAILEHAVRLEPVEFPARDMQTAREFINIRVAVLSTTLEEVWNICKL